IDSMIGEIPAFAEEHYDREDAGDRWSSLVKSRGLERHAKALQTELLDECRIGLAEIARELQSELTLVADLAGDRRIAMDPVFDGKRVWNWGGNLLSGGLVVAALILGSGPLGWAAAGVGLVT